jgi:pullulanase
MIAHPQVDYTQVNYSDKPYATEPTQMIAYVSCHDDMCLTDRLRASIPRLTEEELIRLDLLAQTAVFTSQGVPFMLSGEELLRTKLGVHNSFESPDSINRLDWTNKERYPQVFEGYKGLIAMRKQHPSFRMGSAEMVRKHLEFLDTADGVVAYHLSEVPGDDWKNIWVYLNLNRKPASVAVPMTGVMDGSGNAVEGKTTDIAPLSALILHN